MPRIIVVASRRSPSGWATRLIEHVVARWGWITGRVPVGVTPTLATTRWWR